MSILEFHPLCEASYESVHKYLEAHKVKYRRKNARNKVAASLNRVDIESVALQYYVYFATHFSKTKHVLNRTITHNTPDFWLSKSNQITVLDIGCGAGSASLAFVDFLLTGLDKDQRFGGVQLHFVGVDINLHAIRIYDALMSDLSKRVSDQFPKFLITWDCVVGDPSKKLDEIIEVIDVRKNIWGVPRIQHAFLFQANIIKPIIEDFESSLKEKTALANFGFRSQHVLRLGKKEGVTYRRVFEECKIDNLHFVSVATEPYSEELEEAHERIVNEFQSHVVAAYQFGKRLTTEIKNPRTSFWTEQEDSPNSKPIIFCALAFTVANKNKDDIWDEIRSKRNLELAWARARHHLNFEPLVDQIEILHFEKNLDENLEKLVEKLESYKLDLNQSRMSFSISKNEKNARPYLLSTLEEEILSSVLIPQLETDGIRFNTSSFAYRFSKVPKKRTEYIYEHWFPSYQKFRKKARRASKKNLNGIVIQIDIKSFYEKIRQLRLAEVAAQHVKSDRIEWLLSCILKRSIPNHEEGLGLGQGNLGSGFFANLYLRPIDRLLHDNEWNAKFFRFMDDMIIVVPNPKHKDAILTALKGVLETLGLTLNPEKTIVQTSDAFLELTKKDKKLEDLNHRVKKLQAQLWNFKSNSLGVFIKAEGSNDSWWREITRYQEKLAAIGIYLSREKISRILRKKIYKSASFRGKIPDLSLDPFTWKNKFLEKQPHWIEKKNEIKTELSEMFEKELERFNTEHGQRSLTRLRFTTNKLLQFGFEKSIAALVTQVLIDSPWTFRNPSTILESLAIQGYESNLEGILDVYQSLVRDDQKYLCAIVTRSFRFLNTISKTRKKQVFGLIWGGDEAVQILARETWVFWLLNEKVSLGKKRRKKIRHSLDTGTLYDRVRRNLEYLIGDETIPEQPEPDLLRSYYSETIVEEQYNPSPS